MQSVRPGQSGDTKARIKFVDNSVLFFYPVGSDIKWFFLPFSFLPAEIQDLFFRLIKFIERPPIRKKSIN